MPCRPPGHHAEPDKGMGFCIFNNIAIAAKHALENRGLKRVAIVDYDVHHGNGTQKAFYSDDRVLFISLHQDSNYPIGSGDCSTCALLMQDIGATFMNHQRRAAPVALCTCPVQVAHGA